MVFLFIGAIVAVVLLVILFFCDGDLTLLFYERFGKDPKECLTGKVIWVTGASSGIGRALAIKLAAQRCHVVISARREELLQKVKQECLDLGSSDKEILVLPMDITKTSEHPNLVKTVLEHFGQIDILVNNAGRSQRGTFEKINLQVDRDLFELNVFSLVELTSNVLPHFTERKQGHVAVVSSIAGKLGVPSSRCYTGSKHALHGYFECLRVEKAGCLDITMICPGPVVSNILASASTENPNECYGKDVEINCKRMSAERCAELCTVALANKLDEVWISQQPILMGFYATQYFPTITRWILKTIGSHRLLKLRDGHDHNISKKAE